MDNGRSVHQDLHHTLCLTDTERWHAKSKEDNHNQYLRVSTIAFTTEAVIVDKRRGDHLQLARWRNLPSSSQQKLLTVQTP